ncbi:MAG: prolyl oligopeptidase family serine peptidase, partial [Acutalibacteraceae bacterium]|nr:prolyl oligopeptidase family serine peptidase [Acutalibacteraceae bacterium]
DDSDFPYWASSELQNRFDEKGAFILLPRAPEDKLVYWGETLIESLRAVIDDMIAKHGDHIDTTKIFIGGSSAGGEMTWKMISSFPEYFAGAFPIASTGTVSETDTLYCSDVAIWMISSKKDPVVNYNLVTLPLWSNVIKNNNNPANCRLSVFENVVEPAGGSASDNHHMAKVVTYDFHMLDGSTYPNVRTIDGNQKEVKLVSPNGMISWMNGLESDFNGEVSEGTGNTSVSPFDSIFSVFRNFFLKIVNIFQRILGL